MYDIYSILSFMCMFCRSLFVLDHCVVCSSSKYGFWSSIWYLQTLYMSVCILLLLSKVTNYIINMWFGEINYNIIGTNHVTFTSTLIDSRACGLYHDVLDIGSLLTRNLLSQGFLLVKLKTSYRPFCVGHHVLVNRYGISVLCMYIIRHCDWL